MTFKYILVLFFTLTANWAFATVSGVNVNLNTASNVDATTDPSNIVIFGAYAGDVGGCVTPHDTTSVCNSCTTLNLCGASGTQYQCAFRSIHPDLILTISMTVTDQLPNSPHISVQMAGNGTADLTLAETPPTPTAGQQFTVKIQWSEICRALGFPSCVPSTLTPGRLVGKADTLTVGVTDGSSNYATGASQKFTVRFEYANPADSASLISAITDSPPAPLGFTDFRVTPGDGKVYVSDIRRGVTQSDAAAVKYQAIRVYYAPYTDTVTGPSTPGTTVGGSKPDVCQIPYNSDNFVDLSLQDKTQLETPLVDSKVNGLVNDQTYMFNIATVDEATAVFGFIDPVFMSDGLTPQQKLDQYLAQPGEVVGLLDSKKCFIATAAFGSQMAPQVELLRKFRNEYLIPNPWGRQFVRWYYKNSPPAAEFIAQHDQLRAVVRGFLWPVILFADLSLKMGFFMTFGLFALSFVSLILVARRLRRSV